MFCFSLLLVKKPRVKVRTPFLRNLGSMRWSRLWVELGCFPRPAQAITVTAQATTVGTLAAPPAFPAWSFLPSRVWGLVRDWSWFGMGAGLSVCTNARRDRPARRVHDVGCVHVWLTSCCVQGACCLVPALGAVLATGPLFRLLLTNCFLGAEQLGFGPGRMPHIAV